MPKLMFSWCFKWYRFGTDNINKGRSKRNIPEQPIKRLIGGTTAFTGSFPYVVRLAFQTLDQFHSDSQVWYQLANILILNSFININFKTILSNTICVPVLLLINTGYWHQQHVANVMILWPLHSMIIQFSSMIKISKKSSQPFFTFIRTLTLVLSEQRIFRISWLIFHAGPR